MQRYFAKEIMGNKIILQDNDYHHIKNVMRMKNGDMIEVVFDKILYISSVDDIDSKQISVVKKMDINNELDVDVVVAIGLVKEQKMDVILQKLTELGVKEIIPVKFRRSIVKLDEKAIDKKLVRWRSICKEASEQSKRNIIPDIKRPVDLSELINIDSDIKLVASTKDSVKNISTCLNKDYKKIVIVIGPEGGISDEEEKYLNKYGFNSVSFGKRILRVETAAIYALSVINYSRCEDYE